MVPKGWIPVTSSSIVAAGQSIHVSCEISQHLLDGLAQNLVQAEWFWWFTDFSSINLAFNSKHGCRLSLVFSFFLLIETNDITRKDVEVQKVTNASHCTTVYHCLKKDSKLKGNQERKIFPVCPLTLRCDLGVKVQLAECVRWPTFWAGSCASWSSCVWRVAGRKPESCSSASSSPTPLWVPSACTVGAFIHRIKRSSETNSHK